MGTLAERGRTRAERGRRDARGEGFNVYAHDGRIDLRDLSGWG